MVSEVIIPRMMQKLEHYLELWQLSQPQPLAQTPTSHLYTVESEGATAVLKLLTDDGWEERNGATALRCFDGHGAIRLFRSDEGAQLLEYVAGDDLLPLVKSGGDAEATHIIAGVIRQLHSAPLPESIDGLFPLKGWFRELFLKAEADQRAGIESIFVRGARVADALLSDPRDLRVLHGDIHHANLRYSAARGWLAFDPKGVVGERTYDCANTLCNPYTGQQRFDPLVHDETRLLRNAGILAEELDIDLPRILAYTYAYACLSASWSLGDDTDGEGEWALNIARIIEPHLS